MGKLWEYDLHCPPISPQVYLNLIQYTSVSNLTGTLQERAASDTLSLQYGCFSHMSTSKDVENTVFVMLCHGS